MSVDRKEIYEFGDFRLDVDERTIERLDGSRSSTLPDKAFETLVILVRRRGHLVSKDELLRHVWPDTIVEENNLEKRIHSLRQFLGKGEDGEAFIETVRGHGYRFVGRVGVVEVSGSWLPETYRSLSKGSHESKVKANGGGNGHNGHVATRPIELTDPDEVSPISRRTFRKAWMAAALVGLGLVAVTVGYLLFLRTSSAKSSGTVVILPAVPIQAAEQNDLFEVGIAESLINRLASADGWTIRPLSSVRDYVGSKIDPVEAGRQQKADYVLAANYQIAGGRIKVTSQLFNVATGKIEETFESQHDVANIFDAQDAIAAEFAKSLMAKFGVSQSHPARMRGTNNEEAYRAYIQGMYILDKTSPGAVEYLDRAVTLDPGYAKAWAGKALAHIYSALRDRDQHYPKAVEAINKSLSIDPNQSDAYSAKCQVKHMYDWDYAGAESACLKAIELDPAAAIARQSYSVLLSSQRRSDEAAAQLKVAMELEPSSYISQAFYANCLYLGRRYDEAVAQFKTVVQMRPDRIPTYNWFVRTLEAQGNEAEAYEWFMKSLIAGKQSEETIRKFRTAYETSGYRGVLLERIATVDRDNVFRKAGAYARLGDKDKAFEVLEELYQNGDWSMAVLIPVDPQLDPLRNDPRYLDLLRRVEEK